MDIVNLSPYSATGMIDALKGAADIIEEVSDTEFYFGFCKPGTTDTDEATWSIMKIDVSGTEQPILTTFKWAFGRCLYDQVWDDRADLDYAFKTF